MNSDAPLPSSFDGDAGFYEESRPQKLLRRMREEPLIPVGCALTCWALLWATKSIRAGDHHAANRMFRRRIYAQGFTIAAMAIGGIYWKEDREKRKHWDKLQGDVRRKEKHEAWLRELEARDEEQKAFRAKMERGWRKEMESATGGTEEER